MTFGARNKKSRWFVHGLVGFLTGGLCLLLLSSGCAGGPFPSQPPTVAFTRTSPPPTSLDITRQPKAVAPGPEGWWLVAQRLPQSDFGPGFAYFLVSADTRANALRRALEQPERVPSLCSSTRLLAVRLAPIGGRVAIFCGEDDHGFWVWHLARGELAYVTLGGRSPSGEEAAVLPGNPLWSADGDKVFVQIAGGALASVDILGGKVEIGEPVNGLPLAVDPRGRYLAARVFDASVPAPDGSPKRYEISHLYLLDLKTGAEKRWAIPTAAQKFLPAGEKCRVSDYEDSVGWEPRSGERFLFMVECGQNSGENSARQYVFWVNQATNDVQLLWHSLSPVSVTALWEPHGQGVLLQVSYLDANGVAQNGETMLLDGQGQVIQTWQDFPTATLRIIGWGAP